MRNAALVLLVIVALVTISVVSDSQAQQGAPGAANAAAPGAAPAQPGGPGAVPGGGRASRNLMWMDTNGDGVIAKDEWRGSEEAFNAADTNHDGKIDSAEMAAYTQKLRQDRRQRAGDAAPDAAAEPAMQGPANREMDQQALVTQLRGAERIETLIFRMLDTKRTGKITKQDIDDFAARLMAADANKDGAVTMEEARAATAANIARHFSERFMQRYDKKGDGKVTQEEFGADADAFKALDANGDGVVTADDFTALTNKWLASPEAGQDQNGPAFGAGGGPGAGGGFGGRGGRGRGRRGGNIERSAPAPGAPAPGGPAPADE